MIFGKTVVADGEEVIMVWCCFFWCLSLPEHCRRDAGRGGRWESSALLPSLVSSSLSTLLISVLYFTLLLCLVFLSCFSISFSTHCPSSPLLFLSFFFPLACPPFWPSLLPSILFYHSLPPLFPFSPSPSPSPWFCRGWVEVISRCVTLAMCRQWMGLWQRLDSLGPQWQRRAGEGNNYTYTWEDLCLFTKWKKWDSGYFIYCFIFSPSDWWPSRWMWTRCLWFGWTRWLSERRVKLRPRGASHGETPYQSGLCTAGQRDWLCRFLFC